MASLDEETSAARDRWLLSYADLLTLLFSLFVVLFASAYRDHKKPTLHAAAIRSAFGAAEPAAPAHARRPSPPAPVAAPSDLEAKLETRLAQAIHAERIALSRQDRGIEIRLNDGCLFLPGDDAIRSDARQTLDQIGAVLGSVDNLLSVEGHSDATAIHNPRFRDNWELSAARSLSVIRYLSQSTGLPHERLSAAAFADTRPRFDNATTGGRAQNRRVDIVVFNPTPRGPTP